MTNKSGDIVSRPHFLPEIKVNYKKRIIAILGFAFYLYEVYKFIPYMPLSLFAFAKYPEGIEIYIVRITLLAVLFYLYLIKISRYFDFNYKPFIIHPFVLFNSNISDVLDIFFREKLDRFIFYPSLLVLLIIEIIYSI